MAKKKRNYDLRIIIPTILSVVFGVSLLSVLVAYIIFKNTVILDFGTYVFVTEKICQPDNLEKIEETYLQQTDDNNEYEGDDEETAKRGYYHFEYAVCGGRPDSEPFEKGLNEYFKIKGVKPYSEDKVNE